MAYEKSYLNAFILAPFYGAVMIFALVMWAAVEERQVTVGDDFNLDLIRVFEAQKERADLSVVLLGNSRLRNAFAAGVDPEKLETLPDGRKAALLQFAEDAAHFHDYETFANTLLAARPDIIVVMGSVISNARASRATVAEYADMVRDVLLRRLSGTAPRDAWRAARAEPVGDCVTDYAAAYVKKQVDFTVMRDAHSLNPDRNESLRAARQFIKTALDLGITVVILDLQPNGAVLDRYNVPSHMLDFHGLGFTPSREQLLPGLSENPHLRWISYAAPGEDYCDIVHLNGKGRDAFTSWFLSQL